MDGRLILLLLLAGVADVTVSLHMIANFDQKGVRGTVMFGQHNSSQNLQITFSLQKDLRSDFSNMSYKITSNPSVYDDWCDNVGSVIQHGDLRTRHGPLAADSTFNDDKINIVGRTSVMGKSLVLYEPNGKPAACSTILPHTESVIYADARINNQHISAHLTFIKAYKRGAGGVGGTFVYGELTHDRTASSTHKYQVYISADTADHASCAPLNQMYDPIGKSGVCSTNQESTCKIGDISSKLTGEVSLSGSTPGMISGVITDLPLDGQYSVVGHYVVVKLMSIVGNTADVRNIEACAKINIAGPLEAISEFKSSKNRGIHGSLKFSQLSPYHFTEVKTSLQGLGSRVGGYHIHQFPISDPKNPCSKGSAGGHVNTWEVDIKQSPKPGANESLDKWEVGDLSGRYGGLHGKDTFSNTATDANIPLYGLNTILGRSIVIHEDKTGNPRFTCADIEPENYAVKVSTKVQLKGSVEGMVYGYQWIQSNGIQTRTVLIVDLPKGTSKDHHWAIREKPVMGDTCPDYDSTSNPLYNPVARADDAFCDQTNPLSCKIGDLSNKLDKISLENGKSFYSDSNLPMLSSPHTVIGRSLVIYGAANATTAVACGNIMADDGNLVSMITFNVANLKQKTEAERHSDLHHMLMEAFNFQYPEEYRINSIRTSKLDSDYCDDGDSYKVSFCMIDTNKPPRASSYKCTLKEQLNKPGIMGDLKHCEAKGAGVTTVPSLLVVAVVSMVTALFV